MNRRMSFKLRLSGCIVALTLGGVVATATSVLAQQSFKKTISVSMAQSSSAIIGSWRLASMTESAAPTPIVPPQAIELTAEFSGDSAKTGKVDRVFGSGGCNRFMGGYSVQGDQLTIQPLASTFKACEQSVMNQEFKYLKALQGAQRYEVDDQGQLTIHYRTEQESGVLRFTAQTVRGLW